MRRSFILLWLFTLLVMLIALAKWKRSAMKAAWQRGETVITGIGQGYLLVTPLQLAAMTATLVNGGISVTPYLTRKVTHKNGLKEEEAIKQRRDLNLSPQHLDLVRAAMNDVVNSVTGTAKHSKIKNPEWAMGGKTGTVQVRRISRAEREMGVIKNEDLPWEERDHALFVGFAPVNKPRYAVSVVVEHGGSGSKRAAPIARDILEAAQRRGSGKKTLVKASPIEKVLHKGVTSARREG